MSRSEIIYHLGFLSEYIEYIKGCDKLTVQRLTGSNKSKKEIVDKLLKLKDEYIALLG